MSFVYNNETLRFQGDIHNAILLVDKARVWEIVDEEVKHYMYMASHYLTRAEKIVGRRELSGKNTGASGG